MNSINAVHAVVKCGITVYVSISFFFFILCYLMYETYYVEVIIGCYDMMLMTKKKGSCEKF